jgi:hypothetical protein
MPEYIVGLWSWKSFSTKVSVLSYFYAQLSLFPAIPILACFYFQLLNAISLLVTAFD